MTQRTLFEIQPEPPRLARRSDPNTSHESAAKTLRQLGAKHAEVLAIMESHDRPMLANDIRFDAHKRMKELIARNLVEVCGEAFDETTRRTAKLYRRVQR